MPHFPDIEGYRKALEKTVAHGGSRNELSVRRHFANLLQKYCARADDDIALVDELRNRHNRPDGTVKTVFRLDHGYWEAKDENDDLDREMEKKFRRGYPRFNILFENTQIAVLFQNGEEILRADMKDDAQLDKILRAFVAYQRPEIADFRKALAQFETDLPDILAVLREAINKARRDNKRFAAASGEFLQMCRSAINPHVGPADVREMLIQHILTRDIFLRVFDEEQFHAENNIARRMDELQGTFFSGALRRGTVDKLKSYYAAIRRAAADISNSREKQRFLKVVYQSFYRVYNPRKASQLGVVYTPNEIVGFMVRAADELVRRHFKRRLWSPGVEIMDPAAGTGTFITEMIEFFPERNLRRKYEEEMHANEVAILPYYIANLNIEHAYAAKTGEYREFPGICLIDTLDNHSFQNGARGTQPMLGGLSEENRDRVNRQNKADISVVIGNPPWFANQRNENENNKSREYPEVDARVKSTYIAEGSAQKTKLYDMYARFIRWASDRVGADGILAFVTNSSFIDARTFAGFRKVVAREFNEIHILDLTGNSRLGRNEAARQGGNVFNVRVGVAVWFFVRSARMRGSDIWRYAVPDGASAADKLALLSDATLDNFDFLHIVPDERHNWVRQARNGFDNLPPLAAKKHKRADAAESPTIFDAISLGLVTSRDDWAYDFDQANLRRKARHFCKIYAQERERYLQEIQKNNKRGHAAKYDSVMNRGKSGKTPLADWVDREIKWTSELEAHLQRGTEIKFSPHNVRECMYRPFTAKRAYYADAFTHRKYRMPEIFPTGKRGENIGLCFCVNGNEFYVLAADRTWDYHFTGDSQCVPLYRFGPDGERTGNITAWGLSLFREHYGNAKIKAEDIFHYAYAVLHNPAYLRKYADNLRREFPRLPFYADFRKWAKWGAELMALHLGFETAKPFPLIRRDSDGDSGRAKLQAKQEDGRIVVDEKTTLDGIPPEAWEYKLGGRSALEWVLDQHKEKKVKDPTVAAKFPPSSFSGRKEEVIELLRRVCTVSVETVKIIRKMEEERQ